MAEEDKESLIKIQQNRHEGEGEVTENGSFEDITAQLREASGDVAAKSGCCDEGVHSPLSVQSGDIVLPPARPQPASHSRVYNKLFPIVHKVVKYVFFSENIPIVSLMILIVLSVVTGILGYLVWGVFPLTFNISIQSVQVPNHESSKHWDAYQAVLEQQIYDESHSSSLPKSMSGYDSVTKSFSDPLFGGDGGRGGGGGGGEAKGINDGRCCRSGSQTTMHGTWVLELVYRGRNGKNLLENDRIKYLHKIEEHIYNLPDYESVCHFAYNDGVCDPINSILTYLYPRNTEDGSFKYDDLLPNWKSQFDPSQLTSSELEQLLWYTGGKIGDNLTTPLLRAQVRVGVPLPCYCSYGDRTEEQHKIVTDFFISLIPYLDDASNDDIEVLYGGAEIFDYEVNQAKLHDIKLAAISLAIIVVAMLILTGFSPFLTAWGGAAIVMCWVLSLFAYRVVLKYETFSLLTVVTAFVIIGIGVDDVFVFMNTFKQSRNLEGLDTTHKRLTHTILVATSATFFTSATTTIAFLANAVSEIPAVRQFAIFTGLVVFFCFVTVAMTMPLFLHVWQCWLLPLETFLYKPFIYLLRKRRTLVSYSVLPAMRMTELKDEEETDSGILEDRNSDSLGSDSNSTGSDSNSIGSNSSTSNLLDDSNAGLEPMANKTGMRAREVETGMENGIETKTTIVSDTAVTAATAATADNKMTIFVQMLMLRLVARPVMLPQLIQYTSISNKTLRTILRWTTRLIPVFVFIVILACMSGAMSQLKPSDHPPQFFDPDSNIQKMLDLEGNLTQRSAVNCWDCSAWYGGSGGGGGGVVTDPPVTTQPTTRPTTSSSSSSTHSTTSSTSTPTSPTNSPSTEHTTRPPTTKPPTDPPTTKPSTAPSSPPSSPPTTSPPGQSVAPNLLNNVAVYVVFGVKGVKRQYSTSHVLPDEGEGRQAILNPSFSSALSCPSLPSSPLPAVVRAMCRICRNISNPARGLVLNDSFTCFPPGLVDTLDTCLFSAASVRVRDFEECRHVLSGDSHISAQYNYTRDENDVISLTFLAMAFRSTTRPSDSATQNIEQYEAWEDALNDELEDIRQLSGRGQPYEGTWEALSTTFQTSDYWVEINTEIIAIRGSFYGILISIILCGVVVALLSHNGPVVIAMGLTILGILVTLLGLFKLFGWTLGIIEAVSLSILVGNSLDYCIHLSEGYMATDDRHLVFLNKFKFTHNASIRVKRVLSAISFIGVSILSSALTTFLATLPLLAAQILLFTRFAQILILDTAVAILYTLVFCSTFLSLFGPRGNVRTLWRAVNAAVTIIGTVVLMVIVYVVANQIMSHYNII